MYAEGYVQQYYDLLSPQRCDKSTNVALMSCMLTMRDIGYDEGGFSASIKLTSFETDFNLLSENWEGNETALTNRTANISSFLTLGAAFGALSSLYLNDKLGRLLCFRVGIIVWGIGTLIQVFSSGIYGLLLFARIFAGLGAGLLTVTSPMYLSEVAPRATRGLAVGLSMVTLLGILTLGMFYTVTFLILHSSFLPI